MLWDVKLGHCPPGVSANAIHPLPQDFIGPHVDNMRTVQKLHQYCRQLTY